MAQSDWKAVASSSNDEDAPDSDPAISLYTLAHSHRDTVTGMFKAALFKYQETGNTLKVYDQ